MLANPPFMTPKGGIRPHSRFRVPAKRAEVLFVDYIASHLNEHGRAGIIVPEGIIFQNQNAYRQLRRLLRDDSLVVVVSLPGGVFQPYSGVKTSILILDKVLAPRTDHVAFFKVENDGYELGAQRRPIGKDDLPAVTDGVNEYLSRLRAGETMDDYQPTLGHVVAKSEVAADGDYNLNGERYHVAQVADSQWRLVKVGEVFERSTKTVMPGDLKGPLTYVGLENISQDTGRLVGDTVAENPATIKSLKNEFEPGEILYGKLRPNLNKVWLSDRGGICSTDIYVIKPKQDDIVPELYAYIFRDRQFNDAVVSQVKGAQLPRVNWSAIEGLVIPLPPLEVQRELIAEIEGYQRVMDGARAVIEHWKPRFAVDPDWPQVEIGDICNLVNGRAFKPSDWSEDDSGGIPIIRIQNLNSEKSNFNYYTGEVQARYIVDQGELLFSWSGSRGTSFGAHIWNGGKAILNQHIFKVEFEGNIANKTYLYSALNRAVAEVEQNLHGGVGLVHITKGNLERIGIPLPPMASQEAIVAEIEAERAAVAANRELATKMEQRINGAIARVWMQ